MRKIREENEYVDQIQVPLTHKNRYQIELPLTHKNRYQIRVPLRHKNRNQIQVPLRNKNRYQIQVPLRYSHFHHLIVSNCLTGKIYEDNKKLLQYFCYNFLLRVYDLCKKVNFGHVIVTV